MKVLHLFFLLFIGFSYYSSAQLVNIEKKRIAYKEGFQGNINFSFNIIQNTSKITQGSNTTHLQFVKKKHTFLILNDYTIMKVKSENDKYDLIDQNFQHFRYNYSIIDTNKFNFEFFIQRQQNKIKYIDLRFLTGTGLRFCIFDNEFASFYIAPLFMYENEILSDSAHTNTKMIKASIYSSFGFVLTDKVCFNNVIYYQPALVDLASMNNFEPVEDFRLFSESSLSFQIFKKIHFAMVFELAYDSRPPDELIDKPLFYNLKNELIFKF